MGIFSSTGRVIGAVGKASVKAPAFVFRGLFGRDFLGRDLTQQTKENVASLKNTLSQFKNIKNQEKTAVSEPGFNLVEFERGFQNIRLTSFAIIAMLIWTGSRFWEATQIHDFLAQLSFAILLGVFYLALNRYSYKARVIYKALPNQLPEEDQIITWGKYFTALADRPGLILPTKL